MLRSIFERLGIGLERLASGIRIVALAEKMRQQKVAKGNSLRQVRQLFPWLHVWGKYVNVCFVEFE